MACCPKAGLARIEPSSVQAGVYTPTMSTPVEHACITNPSISTPTPQQTPAPTPCIHCGKFRVEHTAAGYCYVVGNPNYMALRFTPAAPTPPEGEPSEQAVDAAYAAMVHTVFTARASDPKEVAAIAGIRAALKAAYAVDFGAARGAGAEPPHV
jgi:hypothetical protein